jgi:hypothetical protein
MSRRTPQQAAIRGEAGLACTEALFLSSATPQNLEGCGQSWDEKSSGGQFQ